MERGRVMTEPGDELAGEQEEGRRLCCLHTSCLGNWGQGGAGKSSEVQEAQARASAVRRSPSVKNLYCIQ